MNFPSQIFFNNINHGYKAAKLQILCGCFRFIWMSFLIAIIKRFAERCALQFYRIFILFQYFYSFYYFYFYTFILFIESEMSLLIRNFHTKRVIFEIAMMKIFNNCIAGSLKNNYFCLNECSNLYN